VIMAVGDFFAMWYHPRRTSSAPLSLVESRVAARALMGVYSRGVIRIILIRTTGGQHTKRERERKSLDPVLRIRIIRDQHYHRYQHQRHGGRQPKDIEISRRGCLLLAQILECLPGQLLHFPERQ
jgi:hypothetical protein